LFGPILEERLDDRAGAIECVHRRSEVIGLQNMNELGRRQLRPPREDLDT
jgi:hypothetical protein